jgi:hypothetical protein
MGWLHRLRGGPVAEAAPAPRERSAPALAALFAGVGPAGVHSVLDLGPAADSSLQVYSRFAHRVRFADLLGAEGAAETWSEGLASLALHGDPPHDLVFAWDVLDRLAEEQRRALVDRLARLTAPRARLHVVVRASDRREMEPLRFKLCDVDRVRYEPSGPVCVAHPPLLPAAVERLLAPFEVVSAFTLKVGVREYLAVRRG